MESLTIQLRPFFDWLLWVSLQGSVLIGLIVLVQLILRGKLGIRWHYLLWVLLLIRLTVPWLPESKISVFNLLPPSIQQGRIIEAFSEPQRTRGMGFYLYGESADDQETKLEGDSESVFIRFVRMVPLLWLLGAVVLVVYVCAGNLHLWWLVTRERPLTDQKILDLLEDCKTEMGIRTILGVVITDKVKSPALFGFIRPRLLLPAGMLEALSLKELRHVFLHELAHLKRHDIYLGYLSSLLQILHWFNPLIWLAFYRLRTDRELACDALVLARTQSGESKDYGRTIVSLLERFSRSQPLPAMAGILETKAQLKRRITMIARFKKNSYRWSPLAVILVIILACVSLPDAKRTKASETSAAKPAPAITLRLVTNRMVVGYPTYSRDGKYHCYVNWDTGNLVVCDLATGKQRPLTNKISWDKSADYALTSVISPDSKKVAYLWNNTERGAYELHLIGLDGSGHRVIRSLQKGEWFSPAAFSADGKRVLGSFAMKDKPSQLVWLSTTDGSIRVVKTLGKDRPGKVDLSPDGRYIAYDRSQEEGSSKYDIFVFDLGENREIPLVQHSAYDRLQGWTPDGERILFTSSRMGSWDAWLLQVADGKPSGLPKLIKPQIGDIDPLGLTQSGSFYYAFDETRFDVYVAMLDLETGKVLASPTPVRHTGMEGCPDWSPDGRYIAYCSRRSADKTQAIRIRTLATGQERELSTKLPYFSWLRWSPDGRSFLATGFVDRDSPQVIYKIDVHSDQRTTLVSSETGRIQAAELSPDESELFYERYDSGSKTKRFIVRNLQTGREKEIHQVNSEFGDWALSPDGKRLALCCQNAEAGWSLKTISTTGREPRVLVPHKWGVGAVAWTPDGQSVLFGLATDSRQTELWRISEKGGERRKLWEWDENVAALRVHPDGQRVAFGTRHDISEVWVMENFLPTGVSQAK